MRGQSDSVACWGPLCRGFDLARLVTKQLNNSFAFCSYTCKYRTPIVSAQNVAFQEIFFWTSSSDTVCILTFSLGNCDSSHYNEEKRQHHLELHYSLRMDPGFAKVGGLRPAHIASLIYSWGMGAEPQRFQLIGRWEPQIPNQELSLKLKAFCPFLYRIRAKS